MYGSGSWLDTIEEKISGGIRRNNTKCNIENKQKGWGGGVVRDMGDRVR